MTTEPSADAVRDAWRVNIVEQRLPAEGRGHLPGFWPDVDVRRFLIVQHGSAQIDGARDALIEQFGVERTPSRSAIGRFWQRLDGVRFAQ